MRLFKQIFAIVLFLIFANHLLANNETALDSTDQSNIVYILDVKQEIGPAMWRQTQNGFAEADECGAKYILIHMNTYGGSVYDADSIRTKILNSKIPVYVFIDNNAASAGALISIACDSIFMRKGANIGAATVVNQSGEAMPDKYQSYMRSMMRSTAESHGADTIINGQDTIIKWFRDPLIAEAMVDTRTIVEGIIDETRVLTFTTSEAIKHGFCEYEAETIDDVIQLIGTENYIIKRYEVTSFEEIMALLINPFLQSILIMVMIGGIYFELQTPGVGFPIAASVTAAVFYFAPLYLEGLAENWEIVLFVIGLILIALEVFVVPGFGITGISGFTLVIVGLALSLVDKIVFEFEPVYLLPLAKAFFLVIVSMTISIVGSLFMTQQFVTDKGALSFIILKSTQQKEKGYLSVDQKQNEFVGKIGIAVTVLRPAGKVEIDGDIYDAKSLNKFIDKGKEVTVIKYSAGQIYVTLKV